jgi:hypothetical protein
VSASAHSAGCRSAASLVAADPAPDLEGPTRIDSGNLSSTKPHQGHRTRPSRSSASRAGCPLGGDRHRRNRPGELNALTVLTVLNGYCALFTDVALQFLGLRSAFDDANRRSALCSMFSLAIACHLRTPSIPRWSTIVSARAGDVSWLRVGSWTTVVGMVKGKQVTRCHCLVTAPHDDLTECGEHVSYDRRVCLFLDSCLPVHDSAQQPARTSATHIREG